MLAGIHRDADVGGRVRLTPSVGAKERGSAHAVAGDEWPRDGAQGVRSAHARRRHDSSCLMVLCGSNQGFMEGEVLGEKSPLFGRRTGQIKLRPFDFLDAARMLPGIAPEEQVAYYSSLGGTPYYLAAVRPQEGYVENMTRLFFSDAGRMYAKPMLLMRQELREPATYVSILRAIAGGANRPKEIADRLGKPATFVSSYLSTIESLGLVERVVPFGEAVSSKRGICRILDPAFLFWFHFVAPHVGGGRGRHGRARGEAAARRGQARGVRGAPVRGDLSAVGAEAGDDGLASR